VFSKDGSHIYVGNNVDGTIDGTTVTDSGQALQLPGQPASMRGRNS
jgi:hypothetical protein